MAIIRACKTREGQFVDISAATGCVTSHTGLDVTKSVESTALFGGGTASKNKSLIDNSIYTNMAYINLAIPVMNYFLGGLELSVFSKLITAWYGEDAPKVSAIASGQVMFSKKENAPIYSHVAKNSGLEYSDDILIGAEYIEYLIKNIDVNILLEREVFDIACNAVKKLKNRSIKIGKATITRGEGKYWILDDYYFNPECELPEAEFGLKVTDQLQEVLFKYENLIIYLLSIRDSKEGINLLLDQIMYKMFVLPIGYRPRFKKRKDPMTKAYDNIVRLSNELANKKKQYGISVEDVRLSYVDLVNAVKKVMVKNTDPYDKSFRTLFDTITGKKGLIRDRMMGVRADFSGRSVIVVDPEMSVDTIGVPRAMAKKLMELRVLKSVETDKFNKDFILRDRRKFEEMAAELLEGEYAIIGRQPTLYKYGVQAFKVKIVEGNAIVLNPLSCPAFNADFDGDQMHIRVPIGEKAQAEVKNLIANTKNLFYAKSGQCHIAPRQEIIYGLWLASTISGDDKKYKSKTIEYTSDLFDKVYTNKINIYDKVIYRGAITTVGQAAIRDCFPDALKDTQFGAVPIVSKLKYYEDFTAEYERTLAKKMRQLEEGKITQEELDGWKKQKQKEKVAVKGVTEDWFKDFLKHVVLEFGEEAFIETTNKLVKLGFAIAEFFPPAIPVLNFPDTKKYKLEFDKRIEKRELLYARGFETELAFNSFYDDEFKRLSSIIDNILLGKNDDLKKDLEKEDKVKKEELEKGKITQAEYDAWLASRNKEIEEETAIRAANKISDDSGFKQMMDSGARGSIKNLRQVFGMKGRIQKNSAEIFNTIIDTPVADQLTADEHYVASYGSRHDLIDKSISTFKPGYLSRRMCHSANAISIISEDCGDTEGTLLSFEFIKQFIDPEDASKPNEEVVEQVTKFVSKILDGRFIILEDGTTSEQLLNSRQIKSVINRFFVSTPKDAPLQIHEGIRLRSPLSCKKPCCSKCYGRYDGTQANHAAVGLPVGFEASTSIGEPGTQMTMKNFQGGGVAGQKNLTSSFDLMNQYLELQDLRSKGNIVTYDYLAPVAGNLKTISNGDGTKTLVIYDPEDRKQKSLSSFKVRLFEEVKLKEHVEVGESICAIQGQYNIREVVKLRGITYAQKYLAMVLYSMFVAQSVDVNFKHFEVLISSMSFYVCTRGNDDYKAAHFYTANEYYDETKDKSGAEFLMTMKGLKDTPRFREDVFSTMFLEDIKRGIHRSIIVSGKDSMKLPIVRYAFGLNIGIGTAIPAYMEERAKR